MAFPGDLATVFSLAIVLDIPHPERVEGKHEGNTENTIRETPMTRLRAAEWGAAETRRQTDRPGRADRALTIIAVRL